MAEPFYRLGIVPPIVKVQRTKFTFHGSGHDGVTRPGQIQSGTH